MTDMNHGKGEGAFWSFQGQHYDMKEATEP